MFPLIAVATSYLESRYPLIVLWMIVASSTTRIRGRSFNSNSSSSSSAVNGSLSATSNMESNCANASKAPPLEESDGVLSGA
ncbi:hypothetical protein IMSAGC011_03666 [Lachnospiraceae bacterium]|nr:hypothetical protein IMSAGC011_03666 [Lachnospiraceae bacterium]